MTPTSISTPISIGPKPPQFATGFEHFQYTVRRKGLNIFGGSFYILTPDGAVLGYSKQAALKWKEEYRFYRDDSMSAELFSMVARGAVTESWILDIREPSRPEVLIGSVERHGAKYGYGRGAWTLQDSQGAPVGVIVEDWGVSRAIWRFFGLIGQVIAPRSYALIANDATRATLQTNRNPFAYRLAVSATPDLAEHIDPRLLLAGSIVVAATDSQNS